MKYVLDSSVALKLVLPEVDSAKAVRLFDEYANAIHDLLAPDIFTPEVANGLVAAERQGRVKKGDAVLLLHDVIQNTPRILLSTPLLPRAIEISLSARQAVYDCLYLAMAELEQCEFLTADDQFARKMRPSFPFVVSLRNLP